MKNNVKLLLSVLSLVFIFSACNKYEDGPKVSLMTKKARITGTWKKTKEIKPNGTVVIDTSSAEVVIDKDGTITFRENGLALVGTWEFINDKESILVSLKVLGVTNTEEFRILRLKNKELWLKDSAGKEQHFVAV